MAIPLAEAVHAQSIVPLPSLPLEIHRKVWTGRSELDEPFGLESLIGTGEIATPEGLGWYIQAQAHCYGVRARDAGSEENRDAFESQAAFYQIALDDPIAQREICLERFQHYQNEVATFGRQKNEKQRKRASRAMENWLHLANQFQQDFE